MSGIKKNDQEIIFFDLLYLLLSNKKTVLLITFVSILGAVVFAIASTPIYQSQAILSASKGQIMPGQMGSIGSLSGLGSLAGINLGGNKKLTEYVEIIKSREFTEALILEEGIIHYLYEDKWDFKTQDWKKNDTSFFSGLGEMFQRTLVNLSGDKGSMSKKKSMVKGKIYSGPSIEKAVEKFNIIRKVILDRKTNMIKITVESKYPALAKKWVESIVKRLNSRIRNEIERETESSIAYLKIKIKNETNKDILRAMSQLMEQQMKKNMLANIQEDYALKYIDRPVVAEQRIKPKRTMIVILGMIFGMFMGVVVVFLRNSLEFYVRSYKEKYS